MVYITYCNILLLSTGICAGKLAFCVGPRRVIGGEIFDVMFPDRSYNLSACY